MAKAKKHGTGAIVKRQGGTLAAAGEVDAMFGGGPVQIPVDAPLPQISIMRESAQFEMPDGQYAREFAGHILFWHNANQYYTSEYGEGSSVVPDCASSDGIRPDGGEFVQADSCRACGMNRFGSAPDGTAKACQNTIRLYVLVDGEVIPCLLKAPPSSLGRKDSLMRWLTSAPNIASRAGMGTKYQPIHVRFSLRKKDFASGMSASVIELETLRVLAMSEDAAKLAALSALYKELMESYMGRLCKDVATEKQGTE
ncbi:MAG: hypothetical protein IH624_02605 [Phycisphaerae bacterium]|nr:hypothetical protein [Phycisphaerae bacterium]